MDAILALRSLAELHRNFNRQLDVAYIDIESAFDSVDRVALWKALRVRGSGMPPFLLQLIRDLHTGTTARVRTSQGMSDVFYTSGVRQGCILAPVFCCAIDWLMRHCSGCNVLESMLATSISLTSTTLMTKSFLLIIQGNGTMFLEILRHQQALWVSTQTGIKRRSKILELELLQEQSILTIKQ